MTRLQRTLLLVLMFALPLQGVMATSRLCMVSMSPSSADQAGAHHGQGVSQALGAEHHGAMNHGAPVAMGSTLLPEGVAPEPHHSSSGTCKHCAACTLTAAVAPPAPSLAPMPAGFAGYRPIVVPVPHNVADGLERPPRTL